MRYLLGVLIAAHILFLLVNVAPAQSVKTGNIQGARVS